MEIELSCFSFDIYCPGKENAVADAFSKVCGSVKNIKDLLKLHKLCHPRITRMLHSQNLEFSVKDIKRIMNNYPMCSVFLYSLFSMGGNQISCSEIWHLLEEYLTNDMLPVDSS